MPNSKNKNNSLKNESFNYLNIYEKHLSTSILFNGISKEALKEFWETHKEKRKLYLRNSFLISHGSSVNYIGIVLDGRCQVIKEYHTGNRLILAELSPGDYFGESLYFSNLESSPVSVIAKEDTVILKLTLEDFISIDSLNASAGLEASKTVINNLLKLLSQKNLFLQERLEILSKKSIEAKVMTLLKVFYLKQNNTQKQSKKYVIIPMNREEMADYLGVDRTALSHQLSKMKKKGMIDFYKNTFSILIDE